jgi:hypothetical protein
MTHWTLPLWAALTTLAVAVTSTPARACTYPSPMLLPVGLVQPTPDPSNPPAIPSGGQILVQEPCVDAACTTTVGTNFAIANSAGTKLPISFDYLPRTSMDTAWRLIRVRPDTPLAPGEYTLQTIYLAMEVSYPFVVRGAVSDTPSAKFEIAAFPINYPEGNGFACQTIQTSCGPQTPRPVTTQRKPVPVPAGLHRCWNRPRARAVLVQRQPIQLRRSAHRRISRRASRILRGAAGAARTRHGSTVAR